MNVEQLTWQIFRSTGNIGVYMLYRACSCCEGNEDACSDQEDVEQELQQKWAFLS